jgi:TolB-like protein
LYFSQTIPLQLGENVLTLEAVDAAGNTTQFTVVVIRDVRPVRQVGMRLRVALLPFEKQGEASVLSQIVYDYLSNAFVQQQRFDVVERQRLDAILREHKLSQTKLSDPATAAKTGKVATADGILAGMVTETPQSLEVFARFVDVDSAVVLAAEDVYGEDLTPRTMQTLMAGLAWKFRRHFPMHEGFILETEGKRLTTDLAESHGIKRYMKLIVFRSGQTLKHPRTGRTLHKPDTVLGEAQIVSVTADLSEAVLLPSNEHGKVHESDRVITK